jgi:hypothetical protein
MLDNVPQYTRKVHEDVLLLTILAENLSFIFVGHTQFCPLLYIVHPNVDPPNRQHLCHLLDTSHVAQADKPISNLGEYTKVSLSLDYWTCLDLKSFIAITAYYISTECKYKDVLLGFEPVVSAQTG